MDLLRPSHYWTGHPVCLLDFILYVPQQSFRYKGTGLPGLNQYYGRINVLAQGHKTEMPVRHEPTALRSRVKHSTTELLRSLRGPPVLHQYHQGHKTVPPVRLQGTTSNTLYTTDLLHSSFKRSLKKMKINNCQETKFYILLNITDVTLKLKIHSRCCILYQYLKHSILFIETLVKDIKTISFRYLLTHQCLHICFCVQKTRLIETVLLNTNNIYVLFTK